MTPFFHDPFFLIPFFYSHLNYLRSRLFTCCKIILAIYDFTQGIIVNQHTLNYSTQAIDDLLSRVKDYEVEMPKTARNIERIVALLQKAIKFYLPDNGELFDDGYRAMPAVFRLPYPVVAAEFKITNPLNNTPLGMQDEEIDASSKRIALAIEINAENFDAYSWMLPPDKFDDEYTLITLDGAIAIIPVYFVDARQYWAIPPFGIVIPARKIEISAQVIANTKRVFSGELPKDRKLLPFELHATYIMPEYAQKLRDKRGSEYTCVLASQDCTGESQAILGLIETLSCKNVVIDSIQAPKALNKKREIKGKTPFFEYKVLLLNSQKSIASSVTEKGGNHVSPRVHLRRGHIRRLLNKNIWVNATIVGNSKAGVVIKDYTIKTSGLENN